MWLLVGETRAHAVDENLTVFMKSDSVRCANVHRVVITCRNEHPTSNAAHVEA